jgi:prepilin-type N-terminal cleavage/methylation domain-containing protein
MTVKQDGFTLIDVLAAVVIIGIVGVSVWKAQTVAYFTLSNALSQGWEILLSSSKIAEIDAGAERLRQGVFVLPGSLGTVGWRLEEEDGKLVMETVSQSKQQERRLRWRGFVTPVL